MTGIAPAESRVINRDIPLETVKVLVPLPHASSQFHAGEKDHTLLVLDGNQKVRRRVCGHPYCSRAHTQPLGLGSSSNGELQDPMAQLRNLQRCQPMVEVQLRGARSQLQLSI